MDWTEWIEQAKNGDKAAYARLKRAAYPQILFLAERFLLTEAEAAEVTEAVFASARDKLFRLKEAGLFLRWLEWMTASECRERLRDRAPALFVERKKSFSTAEELPRIPEHGKPVFVNEARIEKILAAVKEIPAGQRFPLIYSRYCGYSAAETAAFLGYSEETAAFRIRSGENALYTAVHTIDGCGQAGIADIFRALREYAEGAVLAEAAAEPAVPADLMEEETEEEEAEKEPQRGFGALPVLIAVSSLLLAAVLFFLIWVIRDNRAKKAALTTVEAEISVSAPTPEPGKTAVTAIPASEATPSPTPVPTASPSPSPTPFRPVLAGVEYVPEETEWLSSAAKAHICVQGSMNVRSGPTTKYKSLGTMKAGQQVTVYAAKDSWYLVEYAEGQYGWGSGKYILGLFMFRDGSNENLAGITAPKTETAGVMVKNVGVSEGAKLYRDPSASGTVSEVLSFGTKVCVLYEEGDWAFVNCSGVYGWVTASVFDSSNTMSAENGTYYFEIKESAVPQNAGLTVRIEGTLKKQEYITPENAAKYAAGATVKTKKGTKLKPDFTEAEPSAAEAEPGIPAGYYFDGEELRFIYDKELKLYGIYSYSSAMQYTYKKLTFVIRADAAVEDSCFYPVYDIGVPDFGTVDAEKDAFCFTADRLSDYLDFIRARCEYGGLTGHVKVINGVISEMTIEYEE